MQTWHQYAIRFVDPVTAEQVAALHLGPALEAATVAERISDWWFIRKSPHWRLRCRADDTTAVTDVLSPLVAAGQIEAPTRGIYEPEELAFGGEKGMALAHDLFHRDCRQLLARLADERPPLGRVETFVLLFGALLQGSGLDWFERGDVWCRVVQLRPSRPATASPQLRRSMRKLLVADTANLPSLVPTPWAETFRDTGRALGSLAREGDLKRGLRAVLAHHYIFAANRAGIPAATQATLAVLAVDQIFHQPPSTVGPAIRRGRDRDNPSKVREMTSTLSDNPVDETPALLRNGLVDKLVRSGVVRTPHVEEALRRVPREMFVPGTPLNEAYADSAVYTKQKDGVNLSAASQPRIVAMMLEQLDVRPGQRILEIGAGTGYNAALLGALAGADGHVTTVDVDVDLVEGATAHLSAAGVRNVTTICADGALGAPDDGPFDRIIATVGAYEVPTCWLDQLAPEGRLVVPLRLAGAASRSIVFQREGDAWVDQGSEMSVFMPLRGIGDDSRTVIDLTGDGGVTLQTHQDNRGKADPQALHGVLSTPGHTAWTAVHFASGQTFEWLDLWLACRLDNPIMRMNVAASARESGLVTPMFPIATMATTNAEGALAYLTMRPHEAVDGTGRTFEVGVIGHGPGGQEFAEHVADLIQVWHDDGFSDETVHIALEDTPAPANPAKGRFVLPRPHHPITVEWR